MTFEDFFIKKDSGLIKAVGKKHWKENKVYFVSEIIDLMAEYEYVKRVGVSKEIKLKNQDSIDNVKISS